MPQTKKISLRIPAGLSVSPQHSPWLMGTSSTCFPWHWKDSRPLVIEILGTPAECLRPSPVSLWHCGLTYLWNHHLKYWVQPAFPDLSRHRPPCLLQTRAWAWKSPLPSPVNQPRSPGSPSKAKRIFLGKELIQANVPQ